MRLAEPLTANPGTDGKSQVCWLVAQPHRCLPLWRRPSKRKLGRPDRQLVIVMRERGGATLRRIQVLHARYAMDRTEHGAAYGLPGGV